VSDHRRRSLAFSRRRKDDGSSKLHGGSMRKSRRVRRLSLTVLAFLLAAGSNAGDYYKVENVKRVEQDLYRAGNLYIQTRYCYHYTYGEDALLKWEGPYGDNKIIWSDDSNCQVKNVFKK
jgi:hypothetical protein